MLLPLILQAPNSSVLLILYRVSCLFIIGRIELYLPLRRKVHCADAVKQSILPLSLVRLPINVGLYSHSIGPVIFKEPPVNTVYICLFSEAIALIFDELALVVSAICPSVGPLSIKISICKFSFICTTVFAMCLLAEAMSLVIFKLPLIPTIIIGDQDPRAMHLVVMPVPLILIELVICGINHHAFALSFAILQLAGVKTSLLVLLYSLINLAVALILSVFDILLVISFFGAA